MYHKKRRLVESIYSKIASVMDVVDEKNKAYHHTINLLTAEEKMFLTYSDAWEEDGEENESLVSIAGLRKTYLLSKIESSIFN